MHHTIAIALLMALASPTFAAEGETYLKGQPQGQITKLEAMKSLLTSENKATVYKCVLVELSSKGTVKNK